MYRATPQVVLLIRSKQIAVCSFVTSTFENVTWSEPTVGLGSAPAFAPSSLSWVNVIQSPPGKVTMRPLIVAGFAGSALVSTIGAPGCPPCDSETLETNVAPAARQPVWPGASAEARCSTVANGDDEVPLFASEPLGAA